MNPGGNDPFQGGGWPGNQPGQSQSPWVPAGPPQGSAPSPYPPPPMLGGQWPAAGQPGPWNAPPMTNPPYGQPPNDNNKGPWIIGGVIAAGMPLLEGTGLSVRILDYVEHALSEGHDAKAASYVECEVDGQVLWGVGIDPSITTSSFKAVISALNRALR